LGDGLVEWEELLKRVESGQFGAVWVSGGYKTDWNDESVAAKFAQVKLLVVQDLFSSPLLERATYQLPGAAFAEREGSYVNYNDRLQSFAWAVRPPSGVMTEGQLYWQLLGKTGMYRAREVLDEVAREISYFAAAIDEVPETGIDLKVNQLAQAGTA
jgi:predicted molibdopterin-dependent oxidoreductase YjgC